jgi:hypothetical protein
LETEVAEIEKVTDPTKMVTDPVVLDVLAKQKIDKDYVLLLQDYGKRIKGVSSPYARFYHDLKSGKGLMAVSGLPMVDAYGFGHELQWMDKNGIIENGNNIFHCVIDRGAVRLITLSDQPTLKLRLADQPIEIKKDDELIYHPQLFISGVEILPLSDMPKLLETDSINENYHYNVLEWDFGVCLRRVRLIEGRFLGSWVFLTNPKGDVLIKYNQSGLPAAPSELWQAGKLKLRLQYARDEDTEFIPKAYFDEAREWPVTIEDSATFYPDADPETFSVDGRVQQASTNIAWGTLVGAAGSQAYPSEGSSDIRFLAGSTTDLWDRIYRLITLFDTSNLPDTASISAATLSLHGKAGKTDGCLATPTVNVYSSNPANNNNLVAADYATLGTTAFCDSPIAYADWVEGATANIYHNDFALNASGIAAISTIGVSKFGFRFNYDATSTAPNWVSAGSTLISVYTTEKGAGFQPKLVVTYSTGVTEKSSAETGSGAEVITSGNPIVVTSGAEAGSGLESLGSRDLGQIETGSGLESLGSRDLGQIETGSGLEFLESRDLRQIETGSGLESVGSRDFGQTEAGSGLDISSLFAAFTGYDIGSGMEAALKIAAFISGDGGVGSELSWMLKEALAGDRGGGYDALKALIKAAGSGSNMRLTIHQGQVARPNKEVDL